MVLGREQRLMVGGVPIALPPGHDLPFYQRRDPTYDTYAIALLRRLASPHGRTLVIDVGANVGDTTVAALSAAPSVDVIAVEGSPDFVRWLRRNVTGFHRRVQVVEGFVGPVGRTVTFSQNGSTGGFQHAVRCDATEVTEWVTPAELLAGGARYDHVVWKSDIDGFDIHVAVEHWELLDEKADTIWIEFDPAGTLGEPADVDRLIELIEASGRRLWVYDNLGRRMLDLAPGDAARDGLAGISRWLVEQRSGHLSVPYVDIWALRHVPQASTRGS